MYSLGGQVAALQDLRRLLPFWPALGGGTFGWMETAGGMALLSVGLALPLLAIPLFNRRDVNN